MIKKVKIFSAQTVDEVERRINNYLIENKVELVDVKVTDGEYSVIGVLIYRVVNQ